MCWQIRHRESLGLTGIYLLHPVCEVITNGDSVAPTMKYTTSLVSSTKEKKMIVTAQHTCTLWAER